MPDAQSSWAERPRLAGRLPPEEWYPAHDLVAHARTLTLPGGEEVRVVEAGPHDGAPVLLLHGWACSAYSFRHQLRALAAAGYRAIAVDLRGHGLSSRPEDPAAYTADALVDWVEAVCLALGARDVALVGHSLGGGIAARVALAGRVPIRALAVISAIGFGSVAFMPLWRQLPTAVVEPMLPHLVGRPLFVVMLRRIVTRRDTYSERDIDEYWAPSQFPGWVLAMWRYVQGYDWSLFGDEERQRLGVPLLVIDGERDLVVRRRDDAAPGAADGVRARARVHLLRGVGHMPLEEAPDEVSRLLLEFLAG